MSHIVRLTLTLKQRIIDLISSSPGPFITNNQNQTPILKDSPEFTIGGLDYIYVSEDRCLDKILERFHCSTPRIIIDLKYAGWCHFDYAAVLCEPEPKTGLETVQGIVINESRNRREPLYFAYSRQWVPERYISPTPQQNQPRQAYPSQIE